MSDVLVKQAREWREDGPPSEPFYATGHLIDAMADRIEELEAKLAKCEARFMKALALADEECPYRHGSNSYWDWWYKRGVSIEKLMEGTEDELG